MFKLRASADLSVQNTEAVSRLNHRETDGLLQPGRPWFEKVTAGPKPQRLKDLLRIWKWESKNIWAATHVLYVSDICPKHGWASFIWDTFSTLSQTLEAPVWYRETNSVTTRAWARCAILSEVELGVQMAPQAGHVSAMAEATGVRLRAAAQGRGLSHRPEVSGADLERQLMFPQDHHHNLPAARYYGPLPLEELGGGISTWPMYNASWKQDSCMGWRRSLLLLHHLEMFRDSRSIWPVSLQPLQICWAGQSTCANIQSFFSMVFTPWGLFAHISSSSSCTILLLFV